ncbi:glycosyltransferase family 4 protein [Nocardia asiatica]|uniref:glycosyltransferase family 4 protein n=1 Tax=Nocardia asiatica TaxID=209252 RepID=UPI002455D78A|nr:glycosyltransferase family 4 protein [Nocardia asiatica]
MSAESDSTYNGLDLTVFQLRPISPSGNILDGANAVLMNILTYFAKLGVRTVVHHPATLDRSEAFDLGPGIRVEPVSPMLFTSDSGSLWADPMSHAAAIERIRESVGRSDRFYVHGANLPYSDPAAACPTIHSVHDFVYHEAVTGVLNFSRDRLIAVSEYTGSCIREVLNRVRPISNGSLHVIPNGFSAERFTRGSASSLRKRLGVTEADICLLYPHRSDPDKGIKAAIETIHHLKFLLPAKLHSRLRLLVPAWQPPRFGRNGPDHLTLPPEIQVYASDTGVADNIHVHDWVSPEEMPDYYSIGVATLCLGRVPEAFGNVHIESSLTGTPVVVARVGAQRTSIPDHLVRKVDPGQVEQAASHVAEIILKSERVSSELRQFLLDKYSLDRMLLGYRAAILDCETQVPVTFSTSPEITVESMIRIPPWAAALESGYFHDYSGYSSDTTLLRHIPEIAKDISVGELLRYEDIDVKTLQRWIDAGLVATGPG